MKNYHRIIDSYVHEDRIGVLIEFGMESDFTGKVEEVSQFLRDVTLHIAAADPKDIDELLTQPFVKEPSKKVGTFLSELATKMHDRIEIIRFIRWKTEDGENYSETPPRGPANVIRFTSRK